MKLDDFRNALRQEPFEPFAIRFVSGTVVPVRHPEMVILMPSGRLAVVAVMPEDSEDGEEHIEHVNVGLIESLVFGVLPKRRKGAA